MRWRPLPKGKDLSKLTAPLPEIFFGNQEKKKHRQRFLKEEKIKNNHKRSRRSTKGKDDFWDYDV